MLCYNEGVTNGTDLHFISLFLCSALSSAPVLDDCRVRLRYVAFDQMSESEHLLWLNCAFEALKKGEAKHLQLYEKWSGSKPNYRVFKKEWEVYTLSQNENSL